VTSASVRFTGQRRALRGEQLGGALGGQCQQRSSSSRRKAWPSAVPCSSMKPPPSFITTFMSVSQSLSSA
jgi:hypothetical protein